MKDLEVTRTKAKKLAEWKHWLSEHHDTNLNVWLILAKQKSKSKSIKMQEAIAGALCYGWVDSRKKTIDEDFYEVYFTPRRPQSQWSKANIELVEKMILSKEMALPGLRAYKNRIIKSKSGL